MSQYLIDQIAAIPNIEVRYQTQVTASRRGPPGQRDRPARGTASPPPRRCRCRPCSCSSASSHAPNGSRRSGPRRGGVHPDRPRRPGRRRARPAGSTATRTSSSRACPGCSPPVVRARSVKRIASAVGRVDGHPVRPPVPRHAVTRRGERRAARPASGLAVLRRGGRAAPTPGRGRRTSSPPPGEALLREGDPAEELFVVVSGELEIRKQSGKAEVALTRVGPGRSRARRRLRARPPDGIGLRGDRVRRPAPAVRVGARHARRRPGRGHRPPADRDLATAGIEEALRQREKLAAPAPSRLASPTS